MAQEQNQHLTTEYLSALLDKQLSAREQARCETHLRACQQCQTMLNDLRQTVALLHALPQPALPRSFVLSPEMLRAPVEQPVAVPPTIQLDERRRQRQHGQGVALAQNRSQQRRYILPRTLRAMSTLVAVLGLLFVLSAIPLHLGGAASTTSNGSSYAPHSSSAGGTSSPAVKPHSTGANPAVTPAATAIKTPVVVQPTPTSATKQSPATSSPAVAQWLSVLNPNAAAGRAIDGLLLLILAAVGWLTTRRWRVRKNSPR